jgi:hypothetical protein
MQVNPQTATATYVGETVQFQALGQYLTGNSSAVQDVTNQVTWVSSTPGVATINSSGVATAVAGGSTTITASMESSAGTLVGATAILTVSPTAVPRDLVSVTIIPSNQNLTTVGEPVQFTAIGNYSEAPATVDITSQATWNSSDTSVATINSALGLATSVSGGTTTITASAKGNSGATIIGTATLTVSASAVPRDLVSITVIPSDQNLTMIGEPVQFTAIGNYSASPTTIDLTGTGQVTWKSSDTNVATISTGGLAASVSGGTTTITASATAKSGATIIGTATLTVSASAVPRDLTSITIIPNSQSVVSVGEPAQFIAIGNYNASPTTQDLTNQVIWRSSDVSVATINSAGLSSPVSGGTATIIARATAQSGAVITGIATLSVSANAVVRDLTSITIIPNNQTVNDLGESAQFIAVGNYSGTPKTVDLTDVVTWQSSDLQVVTINSTGFATSNHNDTGTATITASALSNSGNLIVGSATFTNNGSGGSLLPTLTLFELGAGSGTVVSSATATTQAGLITCNRTSASSVCTAYYPVGTTVTLTPTPDAGSSFGGWSANCTPVTATSCQVVMNSDEPVGVIFNKP